MKCIAITALTLAALMMGSIAAAAPVTFHYELTVLEVQRDERGLFAADGVTTGTRFNGQTTFDDPPPLVAGAPGVSQEWDQSEGELTTLSGTFRTIIGFATAANVSGTDFWSYTAVVESGLAGESFDFSLNYEGGFGYDALNPGLGLGQPFVAPPTSGITDSIAFLGYDSGSSGIGSATATFRISDAPLTPAPVPLPASLSFLMGGVMLIGMTSYSARRRHSSV